MLNETMHEGLETVFCWLCRIITGHDLNLLYWKREEPADLENANIRMAVVTVSDDEESRLILRSGEFKNHAGLTIKIAMIEGLTGYSDTVFVVLADNKQWILLNEEDGTFYMVSGNEEELWSYIRHDVNSVQRITLENMGLSDLTSLKKEIAEGDRTEWR